MFDITFLRSQLFRAMVDDVDVFLGSSTSAVEIVPPSASDKARFALLNEKGKTVSDLVIDERVAGAIALRDERRPDAATGFSVAAGLGIKAAMLTGDNPRAAAILWKANRPWRQLDLLRYQGDRPRRSVLVLSRKLYREVLDRCC